MQAKSIKRQLLTYATVAVTTLVFTEICLRTFSPLYLTGYIGAYEYDDELGVIAKKGLRHTRLTDYRQEFITNDLGTVNFETSFDHYEEYVFSIGDSYTQGTGNPADTSYPFQLSLLLNMNNHDIYEPRVGVVNLGLAAYGLQQEILLAERYIQTLGTPKAILQLGCNNDYLDDLSFQSGRRHQHLVDGNPRYGSFTQLLAWATNNFEVLKRLKLMRHRLKNKSLTQEAHSGQTESTHDQRPITAQQLANGYNQLNELAKKHQTILVVSWADCGPSYDWLQNWAVQNAVAFADWCPSAKSVQANVPSLPLHNKHSGGHYRVWVNSLIAKAYYRQLTRPLEPSLQ